MSGILPSDIENGISYEECFKQVMNVLKGRKIIGHSIDSDFKVFGGIKFQNLLKREYYIKLINDQIKSLQKVRNKHEKNSQSNSMNNENTEKNKNSSNNKLSKEAKIASKKIRDLKRLLNKLGKASYNNSESTAKKLAYLSNDSYFFDTAKCDLLHKDIKKPFGLKFLLELFLGIQIQEGSHDSIQDSVATMALYRCMIPEIQHWIKQEKLRKKLNTQNKDNTDKKSEENASNNKKSKQKTFDFDKMMNEKNDVEMSLRNRKSRKRGTFVNYAYKMELGTENIPTMGATRNNDDMQQNKEKKGNCKSNTIVTDQNAYRNFLFDC